MIPERRRGVGAPMKAEHELGAATGGGALLFLSRRERRRLFHLCLEPPTGTLGLYLHQEPSLPVATAPRHATARGGQVRRAHVQDLAPAAPWLEEAIHL